jgi:hypothetical protein
MDGQLDVRLGDPGKVGLDVDVILILPERYGHFWPIRAEAEGSIFEETIE